MGADYAPAWLKFFNGFPLLPGQTKVFTVTTGPSQTHHVPHPRLLLFSPME